VQAQPLKFTPAPADDAEELARAEVYGVLARLFYAPPDEALYAQLGVAVTEAPARGAFLEASWGELIAAARRLPIDAVQDEYVALFMGLGKPEIFLYGSYYIAGALNEKPLVALRDDLALLGLMRDDAMAETEDHIAYLCEVMRLLIAGDDLATSNLGAQQRFFEAHLRGWAPRLFETIAAHPRADFYRALTVFARDFWEVEGQAFDMLQG
jgi:TorA maturation chaperone TorD